jgi:endoglycosylceramidase
MILTMAACGSTTTEELPCSGPAFAGKPLGVRCGALVDTEGRHVLLHGMNVRVKGLYDDVLDDGTLTFGVIPEFTDEDALRMRAAGVNALRLPFNWSALEPDENGGFVESYVDRIAAVVESCRKAGVRVLIDVHQDGYTKYIGDDGAPKWATLPAPPPRDPNDPNHGTGGAAQAAFATFFGDLADSARLRARFAAMLAHVAARFAHDDAVLGFELYNEPLSTDELLQRFDREQLAALRPIVPDKLVFFEPSAIRNVVDYAPLGDGSIGAGSVYAPHVYTGVFAPVKGAITKERLRTSEKNARDEADSYLAPPAITEWGFGPLDPAFADFVQWQQELQDEYLMSSFWWVWKEVPPNNWGFFDVDATSMVATERPAAFAAFARVRPEAIAGTIQSVVYDRVARVLEVVFVGDAKITAPNLISIGGTPGFGAFDATCDAKVLTVTAGEPLSLDCHGPGRHTLRIAAR